MKMREQIFSLRGEEVDRAMVAPGPPEAVRLFARDGIGKTAARLAKSSSTGSGAIDAYKVDLRCLGVFNREP